MLPTKYLFGLMVQLLRVYFTVLKYFCPLGVGATGGVDVRIVIKADGCPDPWRFCSHCS